jgi:hypothetical protein
MIRREWLLVLGSLYLIGYAFCAWTSWHIGKSGADRWYAKHPVMVEYEPEKIVLTHGEHICPEDHVCQWKVWDLDTNAEVSAECQSVNGCRVRIQP